MEAKDLLNTHKIKEVDYDNYLIFEVSEEGKKYLKKMFESVFMEDPLVFDSNAAYAWQDGRRSIVRDIKKSIIEVKTKLKFYKEHNDE